MSDSRDKGVVSDLLDIFGKVDRIVAIAALALTYISNSANQPLLAIVFVVVACVALDTWLWRLATSQVAHNLVSNQGRAVMRPRLATWQSVSLKLLSVVITIAAGAWTISVVSGIANPPTPPTAVSRPPCSKDSYLPLEWNNMVCVPEGNFWMGSDDGPQNNRPRHQVFLSAFWIDKFEVSLGQYAKFLQAHPELSTPEDWNASRTNYPVDAVNWTDAQLFCHEAGKRLPTEAEWEKAARGENEFVYPYGNVFNAALSNSAQTHLAEPWRIGYAPDGKSPYGALDMAGNVAEWVNDLYDPEYYSTEKKLDPPGPGPLSSNHVVRGGSYADGPELLRTFSRVGIYEPSDAFPGIGFRCALSKPQ